jgi:hypothetical protein
VTFDGLKAGSSIGGETWLIEDATFRPEERIALGKFKA